MHDQSLIESLFEQRLRGSITLHPAAKMYGSSEIVGLRAVAPGVAKDEVVTEVDWIPGPWNEVVDVRGPGTNSPAIRQRASLDLSKEWVGIFSFSGARSAPK